VTVILILIRRGFFFIYFVSLVAHLVKVPSPDVVLISSRDHHLLLSPQWPHSLWNLGPILDNSLDLLYNPLVDLLNNIQGGHLLLQLLCTRAPEDDSTGV